MNKKKKTSNSVAMLSTNASLIHIHATFVCEDEQNLLASSAVLISFDSEMYACEHMMVPPLEYQNQKNGHLKILRNHE